MSLQAQANRNISDLDLSVNVALPNAANTVNTNGIDLGAVTPFPLTENFQVRVSTTAGTGANDKNVTIVLQDSADNSTFVNIATLGTTVINEGSSAYAATTAYYSLPTITRRYVRGSASGEANGGNAADGTLTVSLRF
jgi:hypothetical protein